MRIRKYSGAGVFLIRYENERFEVLLGKRSTSHGYGQWAIPGGELENKDSTLRDCAFRELKEETGIDLNKPQHSVLGRCVKRFPFFHWHTYIVFVWKEESPLVPQEFFNLEWVPLEEVNNHNLWISLTIELKAARRLLRIHERDISKTTGHTFANERYINSWSRPEHSETVKE